MTSDQKDAQAAMFDKIGKEVTSELAAAIARLDQRPLMKG